MKTLIGKTITIDVTPNETVLQLKRKIQDKEGIPVQSQKLKFSGMQIKNDTLTLKDAKIEHFSTIRLCLELRGGALPSFKFNSFQKAKKIGFSSNGLKRMIVGQGLNIEGICQNGLCEAFKQKAIAMIGYGVFNISQLICYSKCPLCKKFMKETKTLGICNSRMRIKGKMQGENKEIIKIYEQDSSQYMYFENYDEQVRDWFYINVEVVPFGGILI